MIDLTPLEVRKKKGDFRKALRGYDPALVDDFLDVVADRLDELVRENMSMTERLTRLEHQVSDNRERERALTDALVTAQEMREEMQKQTAREADLIRRTAEQEAMQLRTDAMQAREREEEVLRRLRARQQQLLQSYRTFLAREMAELQVIGETLELDALSPAYSAPAMEPFAAPPPVKARRSPAVAAPAVSATPAAPAAAPPVPVPAPVHVHEPVPVHVHAPVPDPEKEAPVEGPTLTPMGALEIEPLPEEEPFAPEPVDEWEPEPEHAPAADLDSDPGLQDQLALRDAIVRNDILEDEPTETSDLIDLDTIDFGTQAPEAPLDELMLFDEPADVSAETSPDMASDPDSGPGYSEDENEPAPETGAPDHDATVLLENALRAGYRLELDDEDDLAELLLDEADETDGETDDRDPPSGWLDTMIDDKER